MKALDPTLSPTSKEDSKSAPETSGALQGHGYLRVDLFTLFWLFFFASIIGLALEVIFHYIVYGAYESRFGLVWGPFSPIYGLGAVMLTLALNRFYYSHNVVVFLVAMVVGSILEFGASWMMEVFWGAIAWDYTGTFGSIAGRTNFVFGMMWGMLGLFWVRLAMPPIRWFFQRFNAKTKATRIITCIVAAAMVCDIVVTVLAFAREDTRKSGIPPQSPIEEVLDTYFTNEWMEQRFANMTIQGNGEIDRAPQPESGSLLPQVNTD